VRQSFALRHRALRHDCVLRCPPSPIAPPSTKLALLVLLRHRTAGEKEVDSAIVARPRCALRRAFVVPWLRPPARHRHASGVPWLRPLSRLRCALCRALRRASVTPLRHGPPHPPLGDKRCTAAPCHCSDEYLAPPSPFPTTIALPILPGVNSKRVIFFFRFVYFFMI